MFLFLLGEIVALVGIMPQWYAKGCCWGDGTLNEGECGDGRNKKAFERGRAVVCAKGESPKLRTPTDSQSIVTQQNNHAQKQ